MGRNIKGLEKFRDGDESNERFGKEFQKKFTCHQNLLCNVFVVGGFYFETLGILEVDSSKSNFGSNFERS